MCKTAKMNHLINRLASTPGLGIACLTVLCWVLAGFAVADPNLSPGAALGGAKLLFVVLAVLMTLLTMYKSRILTNRD